MHRYKNSRARLCPICRAERRPEIAGDAIDAAGDSSDEVVVRALAELAEPVTFTALQSHLRRGGRTVGSLYGRVELLAIAGRVHRGWLLGERAWTAMGG